MDEFTKAYIKCALWTEEMDDKLNDDIEVETLDRMEKDCKEFQDANMSAISENLEQAGHDFWLTRNHHGAGFWETDHWPEEVGKRLTEAAHAFGEYNLDIDENGKVCGE